MDSLIINRQWSSRPFDERFVTLTGLHERNLNQFHSSQQGNVKLSDMMFRPCADDSEGNALELVTPKGTRAGMSNWAFTQLANKLEAQPGFVSSMPAKLASDVLNWKLSSAGNENAKLLVSKYGEGTGDNYLVRAVTSEKYGRIWNYQLTAPLVERFGDGISGDWHVPGEFGKRVEITKANTTIYGGDRDIFVCLVDEERRITVPNRRAGKSSEVARGFIVTNSEVGAGVIAVYFFTFDYICQNRTIWGLGDVKEIKIRHTLNAPERWLDEIAPAIESYGQIKASDFETKMITAQNTVFTGTIEDTLKNGLKKGGVNAVTDKMVKGIVKAFGEDELEIIPAEKEGMEPVTKFPAMRTMFDLSVGVTAYARSIPFQNERVILERAAGKFIELA